MKAYVGLRGTSLISACFGLSRENSEFLARGTLIIGDQKENLTFRIAQFPNRQISLLWESPKGKRFINEQDGPYTASLLRKLKTIAWILIAQYEQERNKRPIIFRTIILEGRELIDFCIALNNFQREQLSH